MKHRLALFFLLALAKTLCAAPEQPARPNIIIILADDMGFADTQAYGSEIQTPHLMKIAEGGIRFTDFYNCVKCSPSRASIMTGLYPQQAGMATLPKAGMNPDADEVGAGELSPNVVTIAEVLKAAGYATYMSGKWHLTAQVNAKTEAAKFGWPRQRGFARFFGFIPGVGNYWTTGGGLVADNTALKEGHYPEGTYLTDLIADNAGTFIADHAKAGKKEPFFMYVAFNAPHWSITAKQEDIDRYKGVYEAGWDAMRVQRLAKQKEIGVTPASCELSPRNENVPAWDSLKPEQKKEFALAMATYAGMITCMDRGIGRILAALDAAKMRENTVVMFLSDNGACAEGKTSMKQGKHGHPEGRIGPGWANVGNTPYRYWKNTTWEGGSATEFIVSWPQGISTARNGTFCRDLGVIMDLMPTCVELAGATYPTAVKGNPIKPMEGKSLLPALAGQAPGPRDIFWQYLRQESVRSGEWKMNRKGDAEWELFNLAEDPSEIHNVAASHPEKVKDLDAKWQAWAQRVHASAADGSPGAKVKVKGKKKHRSGEDLEPARNEGKEKI